MSENNLCQYKHGKLFLWTANWMYKLPLFVTSLGHHKFGKNWSSGDGMCQRKQNVSFGYEK